MTRPDAPRVDLDALQALAAHESFYGNPMDPDTTFALVAELRSLRAERQAMERVVEAAQPVGMAWRSGTHIRPSDLDGIVHALAALDAVAEGRSGG